MSMYIIFQAIYAKKKNTAQERIKNVKIDQQIFLFKIATVRSINCS